MPYSWNLGTLTSWNTLGHSRPVTGLFYLLLRFESVNHTAVKVNVGILYVWLKSYTTLSHLFVSAKRVSVKHVNFQYIIMSFLTVEIKSWNTKIQPNNKQSILRNIYSIWLVESYFYVHNVIIVLYLNYLNYHFNSANTKLYSNILFKYCPSYIICWVQSWIYSHTLECGGLFEDGLYVSAQHNPCSTRITSERSKIIDLIFDINCKLRYELQPVLTKTTPTGC